MVRIRVRVRARVWVRMRARVRAATQRRDGAWGGPSPLDLRIAQGPRLVAVRIG